MPPKSKPDTSGFEKLKKDLSAGRPDRLYIFHGEETYLRDHYLGRLREAVLTGGALVLPRTVRERSRAVEALLGGVLCPGAAEGGAGWF